MRENAAYVHGPVGVVDRRNQPKTVAVNIEDRTPANCIGMWVGRTNIGDAIPLSVPDDPIPTVEGFLRLRVFRAKFSDRAATDDSHACTQVLILRTRGQ